MSLQAHKQLNFTNYDVTYFLQMCHCIEKVFQLAVATFNKAASTECSKKNLELLISQTNKLRSTDVGLEYCSVFRSSHRLVSLLVEQPEDT